MEISEEQLGSSVYKINLSGRMDIQGVGTIETRFAAMTASPRKAIIVDMSGVPFMSSIGIRALIMNAKAVAGRGGKFVLLNPEPNVRSVLESAAIDRLIPVCSQLDEAVTKVGA
jgi:anti-anti-sigma factor